MPGVHTALTQLHNAGIEIHILTAARQVFIEPLLHEIGVYTLCDSHHYHIHNKTAQVRVIIEKANIQPHECVMIGDLPSDVKHAKEADIHGVALNHPHLPKDAFSSLHDMDFYAYSFKGFVQYVLNN